jgi:hypothetical protein
MRLVPNDAPCMELGEKRNFTFKLSGAVGINSISGTPTVSNATGLTIGTPAVSGTQVTVAVTATTLGTHTVKVSATLSSAEIVVGVVRVKVLDSTQEAGTRDYG